MEEITGSVDLCGSHLEDEKSQPESRARINRKGSIKVHYGFLMKENSGQEFGQFQTCFLTDGLSNLLFQILRIIALKKDTPTGGLWTAYFSLGDVYAKGFCVCEEKD